MTSVQQAELAPAVPDETTEAEEPRPPNRPLRLPALDQPPPSTIHAGAAGAAVVEAANLLTDLHQFKIQKELALNEKKIVKKQSRVKNAHIFAENTGE